MKKYRVVSKIYSPKEVFAEGGIISGVCLWGEGYVLLSQKHECCVTVSVKQDTNMRDESVTTILYCM